MKFSMFIYLSAIAASDYGDESMTYENFLLGKMSQIEDYAPYLARAYGNANAFFQRLMTLEKVVSKVADVEIGEDGLIEMPEENSQCLAIARKRADGKYILLPFSQNRVGVRLLNDDKTDKNVVMQYLPRIPFFSSKNIVFIDEYKINEYGSVYTVGNEDFDDIESAISCAESLQIELMDYGITDQACAIGIDWIKGRLNDNDSTGHSQEVEAESRLLDLPDDNRITQRLTGAIRL